MCEADSGDRQKQAGWLKKAGVVFLAVSLLCSVSLCIFLMFQVGRLEEDVGELKSLLEEQSARNEEMTSQKKSEADVEDTENSGSDAAEGDNSDRQQEPLQVETIPEEAQVDSDLELDENIRKIYLTFDDGPSSNTDKILDILAEYDVKATFFVIGKTDQRSREALVRIVEEGHTLAMHSYTHKYDEVYGSVESFAEDFTKLQDYLYEVTGVKSMVYRFPGGSSNKLKARKLEMREYIDWLNEQGVVYFDWNVASGDAAARTLSADEIVKNCMDGLKKNYKTSVILMHDASGRPTTVEALPRLLEEILSMEDTVILPITGNTRPVQHVKVSDEKENEGSEDIGSQTQEATED
ncbi:MAG: polysaccharide deacetylase [Lachnospiraceae bacterium]|nr:polysaccharide deacetylase [Lachnospiraceae bacterium]